MMATKVGRITGEKRLRERLGDIYGGVMGYDGKPTRSQIEALPESYHLIITLRYQQELSYAEIARIADVPLGTVKTIIYRARARLREALQQYEEEPV